MLEVHDLTVRFGGITALDGVGFSVRSGEMVGLIGPNGAGKTTLFNCLTRRYDADAGAVRYEGEDLLAVAPARHRGAGHRADLPEPRPVRGTCRCATTSWSARTTPARAGFLTAALWLPRVRREEARLRAEADGVLDGWR